MKVKHSYQHETNTGNKLRLGYEILECLSENDLKQTVGGFLHIKETLSTVRYSISKQLRIEFSFTIMDLLLMRTCYLCSAESYIDCGVVLARKERASNCAHR